MNQAGIKAGRAQRVVLHRYPDGPLRLSDFKFEDQTIPEIGDAEFLVRTLFISVDPMLRIYVDKVPLGGAMAPMPLGTLMPGAAVGEVIASNHPDFAAGDIVEGRFGWQHYAVSNGAGIRRVNPKIGPPETALGIGGLPGFTAYVGLRAAGGVQPGETFLVSGAAGAVGSVAGALIRARGGRAVGIAGGAAKCRYLIDEIGYAAAADRFAPDFLEQLAAALPKGADVYFDNVGGPLLAAMMPFLAQNALVLISGLMSQYQDSDSKGIDNLPAVLRAVMSKRIRIQSFGSLGQDALRPEFEQALAEYVANGSIKSEMHIEQGLENLPQALIDLFEHSRPGKVVVRVAPI